eukprot:scaffold93023_cov48-Phaeocystis_antarctica.AAC.2
MGEWVRDGRAADLSDVRVVLLLRTSASAMPPAGLRSLLPRLRTRQRKVTRASVQRACCRGGRDARASGFDGRAADQSVLRVVLPLRTSASAMPAAGPRSLRTRLRKRQKEGEKGECNERARCAAVMHGRVGSMAGQQTRAT